MIACGFLLNKIVKGLQGWLRSRTIKKTWECWVRFALPLVAIILAAISIHDSGVQLELAQRIQEITVSHYLGIEDPASMYQRISSDLSSLDKKIEQAEQLITQSQIPEATTIELEQALEQAKYWRQETDKALFEYRLIDAERCVRLGHQYVDEVLRELSKEVWKLPLVTMTGGILSVGIANLITGTTKEGKPLETVTIAMADPPISPGYPYRVICCYDISPDGATFDNRAIFTFPYNPDDIPYGFHEEDLAVATWDSDSQEWSILDPTTIDLRQETISVGVNHLSYFALIVQYPKPIQPIWWIPMTVVLSVSFLVVFVVVSITDRRQQGARRRLTCKLCSHQWFPKVPAPRQCPKCHSRKWNTPRII